MSKYLPLYDHLISRNRKEWNATFKEIEEILSFRLPKSAYSYPAWWANENQSHSYADSWLKAGWRTTDTNISGQRVRFIYTGISKSLKSKKNVSPKSIKKNLLTNDIYSWEDDEAISMHSEIYFHPIGKILKDSNRKLVFPVIEAMPSIYKFTIKSDGKPSCYIGETDNLKRRFNNYRNPDASQKTNIWLNEYLLDALEKAHEIGVSILKNVAELNFSNKMVKVDLSSKIDRRLIENMAIIFKRDSNVEILNK